VSCPHANPPGRAFCGTCGEALPHVRCRCGVVAGAGDAYCGRCGAELLMAGEAGQPRAVMDARRRFDLDQLAELAAQENKFLETTHKARVTQDDIRKLLAKRRKKF
jgi:hypothetical protein